MKPLTAEQIAENLAPAPNAVETRRVRITRRMLSAPVIGLMLYASVAYMANAALSAL